VAEIKKLRLDNKLGKVIQLQSNKEYMSLDLSTFRGEDGHTRTTPHEVVYIIDKFFDGWYLVPSNLDPTALAIEEDQALYQELVDPPPHIKEQMDKLNGISPPIHPDSKIPKDLQDGLRRACQRKSTPQMEEDMSANLAQAFSLEESTAAIKHLSTRPVHGQLQHDHGMGRWDDCIFSLDDAGAMGAQNDTHLVEGSYSFPSPQDP
jgi:hypothetical protein